MFPHFQNKYKFDPKELFLILWKKLGGSMLYRFCIKHRLQYPKPRFWILCGLLVFSIWFYFSLPKPLFRSPYSTVIVDKNGNFLSALIASDYQWRFAMPDSVPYKFRECIRCYEDEYFRYHPGVNPVSLLRALGQYIRERKVVSGGSTLTMQVIRLSLNNPKRTIPEKLYEILLALRLELRYSKDHIMNLYASHAPFGGNVVGLEAAAWRYYGRPASRLSWGETAALAVLPNAPALVFPGKNHNIYLKKRNRLLDKLCRLKIIGHNTCELAKAEPLPNKPHALPQLAPHLLAKAVSDGNHGKFIRTTIDKRIQQFSTEIATKYARYYSENYINNIAVLVLNTKTGEILAYVGNANIGNRSNAEYVDNVISLRSSGSILKPFLYASMLDRGEILPKTLVSDIPTRIGSYAPQNFEKTYSGAVPADIALAHSLNIPAVRELRKYGVDRFHNLLQNLGFTSITRPSSNYGLALILGAAEVSLYETTSLYASLGRSLLSYNELYGYYRSNDYQMAHYLPVHDKVQLTEHSKLSAGSIWCTLEALLMVNRPRGETGWEYFASAHKIAWKTGTSYGSRDAWAIGITPQYTVGVWVGNSTGEGRPGLVGVTHAAPVMFGIFKYLNPTGWFDKPTSDMVQIAVCRQSGYRATRLCDADTVYVPKNGIKVKACPFHQPVFLDSTETYRVTAECYPVSKMHIVPWFILPPSQEYFYRRQHPEYMQLPPYMKGCTPPHQQMLNILEPDNNTAIYIPKGIDGKPGKLIFEAVHRDPNATIFWHIDNEYITKTNGIHKIEVSPKVGMHTLTIEDENGNMVKRKFQIIK